MERIKKALTQEFMRGYSLFDKLFMVSMLLVQIAVFCVSPDSVLGIIAGISGVISVVLCAKGKISFYFLAARLEKIARGTYPFTIFLHVLTNIDNFNFICLRKC